MVYENRYPVMGVKTTALPEVSAQVVAVMATFYSLGVPLLFMILVYKFKYHATQGGDKVVHRALGWMFAPFKNGKEWWLGAEYVRETGACLSFLGAHFPLTSALFLFDQDDSCSHADEFDRNVRPDVLDEDFLRVDHLLPVHHNVPLRAPLPAFQARRDSAEHLFRSSALQCTATARILIPC